VKALGLTLWRSRFERDNRPVIRQSDDDDDDDDDDDARHLERILIYDKNWLLSISRPFLWL
jgi:hypothetical protein